MMTDAGMSNSDGGGGDDGFFGKVGTTITDTFDKFLPIWAGQELQQQSRDQLNQTTFNPAAAPARVNDGMKSTTQTSAQLGNNSSAMQKYLLIGGGVLLTALVLVVALKK